MQAVILAAGRGTRMGSLTEHTPKAMLRVAGKTLLEHELDTLPADIEEVIIVVGYLGSVIQQSFGGTYRSKSLLYVEQETLDGTAGALWRTREVLRDRFIVMMADDLYATRDIQRALKTEGWVMGVKKISEIRTGGSVKADARGHISDVEENHERGGATGLVNINLFVLDTRIFKCPMIPKSEGSDEYGLPQTALAASQKLNIPFLAMPATFWIQITTPADIKKAEEILARS